MYRIGIDIGGTKINVGLFDEKKLIESKKEYIQNIKALSEYVKQVVAELAATHGVSVNEIVSCGIGIPGTVSEDGRHILKAPNIDLLSDGLVEELEETLHIPVGLIQDSRAAAWGEYLVCEKKPKTLVCITLGTGIGTGIVIDGRIYHGALGAAGELGHLPVVHDGGRPCGCGATGCLEKYCAGGGLDLTAKELFGEGKSAADLFEEMKNGNEAAKHAISDAVKMLGAALVSIVNLLSPDCILFSGGLSLQTELYLNPVMEYIRSHCYRTHTLPEMRAATLADASPLYGAAWMPM